MSYRHKSDQRANARRWYKRNRQKSFETRTAIMRRQRNAIFALLGKQCVRCGFTDERALQFDHIEGGGNRHRKKTSHYQTWVYIVRHPDEFQVLCANCNQIKRYENREGIGYGSMKSDAKLYEPILHPVLPFGKDEKELGN